MSRAPKLCLALATMMSPAALACARTSTQRAGESASTAACAKTYVLTVHPSTIVSNELHRLYVRALADSCGHQTPVSGAGVHLLGYRATTGPRGRCTLDVKLPTGHYRVRLFVHGQEVAHTSVSAIPLVAH